MKEDQHLIICTCFYLLSSFSEYQSTDRHSQYRLECPFDNINLLDIDTQEGIYGYSVHGFTTDDVFTGRNYEERQLSRGEDGDLTVEGSYHDIYAILSKDTYEEYLQREYNSLSEQRSLVATFDTEGGSTLYVSSKGRLPLHENILPGRWKLYTNDKTRDIYLEHTEEFIRISRSHRNFEVCLKDHTIIAFSDSNGKLSPHSLPTRNCIYQVYMRKIDGALSFLYMTPLYEESTNTNVDQDLLDTLNEMCDFK